MRKNIIAISPPDRKHCHRGLQAKGGLHIPPIVPLAEDCQPQSEVQPLAGFVCPLMRMALSVIGTAKGERATTEFGHVRRAMRSSLKKFMLYLRGSDNGFFDSLIQADDASLADLIVKVGQIAKGRLVRGVGELRDWAPLGVGVAPEIARVERIHPDATEVLRTINSHSCRECSLPLTFHLQEHHRQSFVWDLGQLLINDQREQPEILPIILALKGGKCFAARGAPETDQNREL